MLDIIFYHGKWVDKFISYSNPKSTIFKLFHLSWKWHSWFEMFQCASFSNLILEAIHSSNADWIEIFCDNRSILRQMTSSHACAHHRKALADVMVSFLDRSLGQSRFFNPFTWKVQIILHYTRKIQANNTKPTTAMTRNTVSAFKCKMPCIINGINCYF